MDKHLAVIVMAAGKGTRMNNPNRAKVMYTVNGKPMIDHVVDLGLKLHSARTVVIVGWHKDTVVRHLAEARLHVICVEQKPQLGTGHAVMQAEEALRDFEGDILVLSGDVPLLSFTTARGLIEYHRVRHGVATVLTAVLDEPAGYGRVIRDGIGHVIGIVEHRDATPEQQKVREINSGIYVFDKLRLFEALQHISPANMQKEYYLTDVFRYFWRNNLPVLAVATDNPREVQGVNTEKQLEEVRGILGGS